VVWYRPVASSGIARIYLPAVYQTAVRSKQSSVILRARECRAHNECRLKWARSCSSRPLMLVFKGGRNKASRGTWWRIPLGEKMGAGLVPCSSIIHTLETSSGLSHATHILFRSRSNSNTRDVSPGCALIYFCSNARRSSHVPTHATPSCLPIGWRTPLSSFMQCTVASPRLHWYPAD
jgi:hypothetical protein